MTTALQAVIDASVAAKLFVLEPQADRAAELFACLTEPTTQVHVPDLLYLECASVFRKQVQQGNCTEAKAQADLVALHGLPLQRTAAADLTADALRLALAHGLSVYDACYVALAQKMGVPLITADEKLIQKLAGTPHTAIWLGNWSP